MRYPSFPSCQQSLLALSVVCLLGWSSGRAWGQQGGVTMPFRYRNAQNGATIQGNAQIQNCFWDGTAACPANHKDPGNNNYPHAHLPGLFPFNVQNGDNVTTQKSDWAWDADYAGYTRVSGSTFELNCFGYASEAPTAMFKPGWETFTDASTQCENTNKTKSYGDDNHCIKITATQAAAKHAAGGEVCTCTIKSTIEKNASGGVYSKDWGAAGIDADKSVRKHK